MRCSVLFLIFDGDQKCPKNPMFCHTSHKCDVAIIKVLCLLATNLKSVHLNFLTLGSTFILFSNVRVNWGQQWLQCHFLIASSLSYSVLWLENYFFLRLCIEHIKYIQRLDCRFSFVDIYIFREHVIISWIVSSVKC